jgi:hypothetical protein
MGLCGYGIFDTGSGRRMLPERQIIRESSPLSRFHPRGESEGVESDTVLS